MKFRHLLGIALLIASGQAAALDSFTFGNTYHAPQAINDQYSFSLSTPTNGLGGLLTFDFWSPLNISITNISLVGGSSFNYSGPGFTTLNGLTAGNYTLSILGAVTGNPSNWNPVGYSGTLLVYNGDIGPASVPEPGTLALFGLGLVGAAFVARRKARQS